MFAESLGMAVWLATAVPVPAASAGETADTIEIVSLLIDERLAARGEAPDGSYLVVAAETLSVCPPETEDPDEHPFSIAGMLEEHGTLSEVPDSLRRELVCQQEGGMLPTSRFENAEVVSASQIAAIFAGDGWWEEFYKTFPGSRGFIAFTAPVFSDDRRHALVYVSHSCGGLCGTGWLVYLSRATDGHWRIASRRMLWIS